MARRRLMASMFYFCISNVRHRRRPDRITVDPAANVQVRTKREPSRSLRSTYYRNGSLPNLALVLPRESQGLQNPYSSVRSRPAPPTFQPVNPTQIKGLSRLAHPSFGRVFVACNMPDFAPKWQMSGESASKRWTARWTAVHRPPKRCNSPSRVRWKCISGRTFRTASVVSCGCGRIRTRCLGT